MTTRTEVHLSRRERQIMDVLWARGRASVAEVHRSLPDAPGYSAVRALLGILVAKGHLRHKAEGHRYIYFPARPRAQAGRSAVRRLLATFFDNSAEQALAALLDVSDTTTPAELDRLAQLIEKARKEGR
jgi:BlaI family transcriptional regulator, penicillinase repressor